MATNSTQNKCEHSNLASRYITVGVDYRPLCTEDPNKDSLLPVNDSAWNSGVSLHSVQYHCVKLTEIPPGSSTPRTRFSLGPTEFG